MVLKNNRSLQCFIKLRTNFFDCVINIFLNHIFWIALTVSKSGLSTPVLSGTGSRSTTASPRKPASANQRKDSGPANQRVVTPVPIQETIVFNHIHFISYLKQLCMKDVGTFVVNQKLICLFCGRVKVIYVNSLLISQILEALTNERSRKHQSAVFINFDF